MAEPEQELEVIASPETGLLGITVPFPLPEETIRTTTIDLSVMLGELPDELDVGLYLELAPPVGSIRVHLDTRQLVELHDRLHVLVSLDADTTKKITKLAHNIGGENP